MAITGTVTSAQGVLTLGSTPNDSITFTPASGTYTVEYPIGTVAIAASTSAQTLSLANGGQMRILCVSGSVAYSMTDGAFGVGQLTLDQVTAFNAGSMQTSAGAIYGLAETSPYVTPTASAGSSAFSGACELAGWYCSVAAGTITIYDALSATGTPIVPATTLVVGPLPIMGAGTTGKIALTTGCWVVLSGAATVRVLVA